MNKTEKAINDPVFVGKAVYGHEINSATVKLSRVEGIHVKGSQYTIETLNTLYNVTFSDSDYRDIFIKQIKDRGFK